MNERLLVRLFWSLWILLERIFCDCEYFWRLRHLCDQCWRVLCVCSACCKAEWCSHWRQHCLAVPPARQFYFVLTLKFEPDSSCILIAEIQYYDCRGFGKAVNYCFVYWTSEIQPTDFQLVVFSFVWLIITCVFVGVPTQFGGCTSGRRMVCGCASLKDFGGFPLCRRMPIFGWRILIFGGIHFWVQSHACSNSYV